MKNDIIEKVKFSEIDVNNSFFDSLKQDYDDFESWFKKKNDEYCYIMIEDTKILGFLYLKTEFEEDTNIEPKFGYRKRLKIGTFKIDAHGTVLGQRFLNIIFQNMVEKNQDFVYVTLFKKQIGLINLFEKFGFRLWGTKGNGELVYYKNQYLFHDIYKDFPRISLEKKKFLLGIWPKYHTKMFPDSKLHTEKNHIIEDLSFTNTIEKIYIAGMRGLSNLERGDLIVIYRTKDNFAKSAEYSSVATSICTVVDIKHRDDFSDLQGYLNYCGKGSIFSKQELMEIYEENKYPYIIKMLYNVALPKRIIRQDLITNVGLSRDDYFGFMNLTDKQFLEILEAGEVSEGFTIN